MSEREFCGVVAVMIDCVMYQKDHENHGYIMNRRQSLRLVYFKNSSATTHEQITKLSSLASKVDLKDP